MSDQRGREIVATTLTTNGTACYTGRVRRNRSLANHRPVDKRSFLRPRDAALDASRPHDPGPMPVATILPAPAADPAVRGVYCLREPIDGLWAYYSRKSDGTVLSGPVPARLGLDTAFLVAGLFHELDRVDPLPVATPAAPAVVVLPFRLRPSKRLRRVAL